MSDYSYYPLELSSHQPFHLESFKQSPQHPQTPFDFDFASFGIDHGIDPQQCTGQDVQEFDDDLEALLAQDVGIVPTDVPVTDHSAIFERVRTGTPTRGVPSSFTVSSESASAYGSAYNESESVYTYHSTSDLSALYEPFRTMNFQSLGVVESDYSAGSPISSQGSPNSNIAMNLNSYSPNSYSQRGSYSDYEPSHIRVPPSSASDYYSHMTVPVKYSSSTMQATVSPANVSAQLPNMPTAVVASQREVKQDIGRTASSRDPKRKYQCPNCPRAFARAFNLKTHIQTHDPNRLKPYACQHKSCGRAFSRKHDLTRHLISIHRSDVESVGVANGARARCEDCGASAVNGKVKCDCQDKK